MSNTIYAAITRQSGLMKEMQVIANNLANAATSGFKAENVVFAEHVKRVGPDAPSLSMAVADAHYISMRQGVLEQTDGTFDLAIEGEGFFQVETPDGPRLTRSGAFTPSPEGILLTMDGYQVLDAGGAPVFVPTDANSIGISGDGTISADGAPIGQIGLVVPDDPNSLTREGGLRFAYEGDVVPVLEPKIVQGFLEASNVDPINEVARMIETQRAYEMGASFLEEEDRDACAPLLS